MGLFLGQSRMGQLGEGALHWSPWGACLPYFTAPTRSPLPAVTALSFPVLKTPPVPDIYFLLLKTCSPQLALALPSHMLSRLVPPLHLLFPPQAVGNVLWLPREDGI